MVEDNTNSEGSFQMLEVLSSKLQAHVDNTRKSSSERGVSSSGNDIQESLTVLFTLLFDFNENGMLKVAQKCGTALVQLIRDASDDDGQSDIEVVNDDDGLDTGFRLKRENVDIFLTSMLCISAICNYDSARDVLVETTPIMKICIQAVTTLKGNEPDNVSMRDKILSCLSTLVRGNVIEAVEEGIVPPMVELLQNEGCFSDQKGAAGIILSLIEPEKGQTIGARVLLSGVVPMLFRTLAKTIPDDKDVDDPALKRKIKADKIENRNLRIIGLRCVATVLRHQKLARESARQFFVTEEGENHLRSVVEHCNDTGDTSRWLFASEILVWLMTEESCHGILGRLGARRALQKVVSQANPYGKWPTLVNQAVSVKTFPFLWTSTSIFQREQHAFLAMWINRYVVGGFEVSRDANIVRQKLCSTEWIAFTKTLLASPDLATRKHAHAALQSLMDSNPRRNISSQQSSRTEKSSSSTISSRKSKKVVNNQAGLDLQALEDFISKKLPLKESMYTYLINGIGLDPSEEKQVVDSLATAKLPLHILLRPGIDEMNINNALTKLHLGTRLATMDSIRELRKAYNDAIEVVKRASMGTKAKAEEIPDISKVLVARRSLDEGENTYPSCFISYCWAQKDKAKALRRALENEGIKCWMDENQMEGGDMLFEEIDDGISASEVVVSCLSPEYSKSVNCNREFLLASDRKKATIPVILEDLEAWPPRGNLGPLLAGKLYIKIDDQAIDEGEKSTEVRQLVQSVVQLLSTSGRN